MTKKEAAIITAYTGYVIGDFQEAHKYIEEKMGRPVSTREIAKSNKLFHKRLHTKIKPDFCAIKITE